MKRLRPLSFIFLLLLLLSLSHISSAQNADLKWYFAIQPDQGALIAYTADGQTRPLLNLSADVQPLGWRLSEQSALAVLVDTNGAIGLYELTPEGATILNETASAGDRLPLLRSIAASAPPYYVLSAEDGLYGAGLLVDMNSRSYELLNGETLTPVAFWRFSADGARLHYISRETRETELWQLRERQLASGDERVFQQFEANFPFMNVDQYGERWLFPAQNGTELNYDLFSLNGSRQTLASFSLSESLESLSVYRIFGQSLLVFDAPCATDCSIERRPLGGGTLGSYRLSAISSAQFTPLAALSDNGLLVMIDADFWLLRPDADGLNLGTYNVEQASTSPEALISSDGQWATLPTGDGRYQVWYLPLGVVATEGALSAGLTVSYSDGGIIITSAAPAQSIFYRYADGASFDLPRSQINSGFYFEALEGGQLLYSQTLPEGDAAVGIYLYNPDANNFSLLAEGFYPLLLNHEEVLP